MSWAFCREMKKAYFIADLHLGATYDRQSREVELSAVRFLESIKGEAAEIYLMGDVLDYWFEYKHVVPKGYVRFLGKLAELSDSGIKITWMIGNHDIWIFDYLPKELGIKVVDGMLESEVIGTRMCLQHGDGVGGNRKFRMMRSIFRNRVCQRLYSGIHPRWTVGFAYGWSRRSRLKKAMLGKLPYNLIGSIREWCELRIKSGDKSRYYVFGHLHEEYDEKLEEGRRLIVLPALCKERRYGVYDGESFRIETF